MVMKVYRHDPYPSFRYTVTIDDIPAIGFNSIEGLGTTTEVAEHLPLCRFTPKLLPEATRFEPVTLRRGVIYLDVGLDHWREQVYDANNPGSPYYGIRRNVIIRLLDKAGINPIVWKIYEAWPSSLTGPSLDANQNNLAFNEITLQNEGQRRIHRDNVRLEEQQTPFDVTSNLKIRYVLPSLNTIP